MIGDNPPTGTRDVEAPGASGWEGPFDRAVRAGKHVRSRNRMVTVERLSRKGT